MHVMWVEPYKKKTTVRMDVNMVVKVGVPGRWILGLLILWSETCGPQKLLDSSGGDTEVPPYSMCR
jgi:hypothetical protein